MSAPQPPNQPWQGGQPQQWQGEPDQEQQRQGQQPPAEQNPALSTPGPTQVLGGPGQQPGTPPGGQPGADGVERTQVVRPEHQQGHGDTTQMVPPGTLPPQQPPYAPPPSAADHPQSPQGGFPGQPSPGFGQPPGPPPGYGPPQGFGQQPPPPPGYGPPPGGFAQQPGLGHGPTFGGPGQNTQMISWIIVGVVGLLGLIVAIIALTDLGDLGTYSDQYGAIPDGTPGKDQLPSPGMMYLCTIAILVGALGAIGGGVLIFMKHKLAAIVTAVAGGLMLIFAIVYFVVISDLPDIAGTPSLPVWGVIGGILVGGAGALGFFPQTRKFLGGESVLAGPGRPGGPGGFGPPPGGGFPGQPGFDRPPPPPWPPHQGFGQPPQGPGQPPQQPGGYGPPPPGGQPPQQW